MKAELSKSVIKTDDNEKCFRQIRILMVRVLKKNSYDQTRDLNPEILK
jgi:hypothetical protein